MKKMKDIFDRRNADDMMLLCSEYMEVWRNYFVFVSLYENIILLVNTLTFAIDKIITIDIAQNKFNQFRYFTIYNNDIILVPFSSTEFIKINLESGKQVYIKDIYNHNTQNVDGKFLMGIKVSNCLWCVRQGEHSVICMDLENEMKQVVENTIEPDIVWSDAYVIENGHIYIPSMNKNKILVIDCQEQRSYVKNIKGNNDNEGMLDIAIYNKQIYLYDKEGNSYLLLTQNDPMIVKQLSNGRNFVSRQSFTYKDSIYRVGLYENSVCKENMETGAFQKISYVSITKCHGTHTHHGCIKDNFFYFQSRYGQFFRLNLDNLCCEEIIIKENMRYKEMRKVFWKRRLNSEILFEENYDGIFGIKEYILEIKNM